ATTGSPGAASAARPASRAYAASSASRHVRRERRVDTIIQSRSKTVVIGSEQPFCIIGERINPTGRKSFQAQLQAGDLSQLEIDVSEQGAADVLDVNVGDPLADEIELIPPANPPVQGPPD